MVGNKSGFDEMSLRESRYARWAVSRVVDAVSRHDVAADLLVEMSAIDPEDSLARGVGTKDERERIKSRGVEKVEVLRGAAATTSNSKQPSESNLELGEFMTSRIRCF